MQKQHALRHLLLRHLWLLRRDVPDELYDEVTGSLAIERNHEGFTVRWARGGAAQERAFGSTDFVLYQRGDFRESAGSDGVDRKNAESAHAFACEALGVPVRPIETPGRSLHPNAGVSLAGAVALGAALAAASDWRLGAAIAAMLLFEFAGVGGKALAGLHFGILGAFGAPAAAFLGGLSYAGLQLLDPNRRLRALRVATPFMSLAALGATTPFQSVVPAPIAALITAVAAVAFFFRWTSGAHFRTMPLVLPFLAIGFHVDRLPQAGWLLLAAAALSAAFAHLGWRALPVRKADDAFRDTMTRTRR